jgi:hypothetical protein
MGSNNVQDVSLSEAEVRSRYETGSLMQVRVLYMRQALALACADGLPTRHQLRVDQMKVRRRLFLLPLHD